MRHCPACGVILKFEKLRKNDYTDDYFYSCGCGHYWNERMSKDGKMIAILETARAKVTA